MTKRETFQEEAFDEQTSIKRELFGDAVFTQPNNSKIPRHIYFDLFISKVIAEKIEEPNCIEHYYYAKFNHKDADPTTAVFVLISNEEDEITLLAQGSGREVTTTKRAAAMAYYIFLINHLSWELAHIIESKNENKLAIWGLQNFDECKQLGARFSRVYQNLRFLYAQSKDTPFSKDELAAIHAIID